jgi:hypothetical protein
MSKHDFGALFLVAGLGFCLGCGGAAPEAEQGQKPPKASTFQIDGPVEINLSELLSRPRKELAGQAAELAERIRLQQRNHREGELAYNLLPDFHLPLAVPIFRKASYSTGLQLSLPPYLDEAKKDSAIALHLARYGDAEAALRLAPDSTFKNSVEKSRYEKNYPLEWTRLTALHLHNAQVRLATGDEQAGRLLVSFHKQLQTILGPKARAGQLGAILLPRGRSALAQAAVAWRKAGQTNLADQADAVLAQWGETPEWWSPFLNKANKEEIARLLASKGKGHALIAANPARALDLFDLPIPGEEVDTVIACLNGADKLAEVVVTYQPAMFMLFPKPEHLAQNVEDWSVSGRTLPAAGSIHRRSLTLGDVRVNIATASNHTALGAIVRVSSVKALKDAATLDRVLGVVRLDQAFEQNRLRFAPRQRGPKLIIDEPEQLKTLVNIASALEPATATLESDPDQRVVTRLTVSYAPSRHGLPNLGLLGIPLWQIGGAARIEPISRKDENAIALVWEDAKTRYVLTLPYGKLQPARLEAVDRTSAEETDNRGKAVVTKERSERRQRIQHDNAQSRIKRERENLRLGMTEAEVVKAIPQGEGFIRRQIPGGLSLVVNGIPEESPGYIPRELFVRFGPDKRAAEVRIRYTSHPSSKAGLNKLLDEIHATCGAPRKLSGSWQSAWADYPKRAPSPTFYAWEDDITILTCQRDSEGVELTILDRPLDQEDGVLLDTFQCVADGPKDCTLGMTKAELLKRWQDSKPVFEDNVLVLTPPEETGYSQFQANFKGGAVVRIVALHAQKWDKDPGQEKLEEAVQQAWHKQRESFGNWRRADTTPQDKLQSLSGHDDVRRVCVFWQETKAGPRLYTEWTALQAAKK